MIIIYTDGSCLGNPGPGGWAAIIITNGMKERIAGYEESTTNNRMEILAVIRGLQTTAKQSEVTVVSDSQYVVNTMTKGWKRNVNQDLWSILDVEVKDRLVKWEWVHGHAGNPGNEEADALANEQVSKSLGNEITLAHFDHDGRVQMVDVGGKSSTSRTAVAKGSIYMQSSTLRIITEGRADKGDVLSVAKVAGIMGAKRTSELVPLCHPIPVDQVAVDLEPDIVDGAIHITATARTMARTGVEMEAMMAVSITALTVYDMLKGIDKKMHIEGIRLIRKSGGKSGNIDLEKDSP